MPELPDVEGFRRYFKRHAEGRRIESIRADKDIVRNSTPQKLRKALPGGRFASPDRHGKWLICPADSQSLLLHFGMTGSLVWSRNGSQQHAHDRLSIHFDDGVLRYRDMRKLGGAWLVERGGEDTIIGRLGPDAWAVSKEDFTQLLQNHRRSIKPALMDQEVIAGLGNLTVDETLFHARLNPKRSIASFTAKETGTIYRKMRHVLRASIGEGLVPAKRSWITAQRRRDGVCPRCGHDLDRGVVGGRTTYWCPWCQPADGD
jgi:formamidopyrimidine-DNA glycosylase